MKAIFFAAAVLASAVANAAPGQIGETTTTMTCLHRNAHPTGPILGTTYKLLVNEKNEELIMAYANCTVCRIMPAIYPVISDEVVGTIQTIETKELTLTISLESLLPTRTHVGSALIKSTGATQNLVCEVL